MTWYEHMWTIDPCPVGDKDHPHSHELSVKVLVIDKPGASGESLTQDIPIHCAITDRDYVQSLTIIADDGHTIGQIGNDHKSLYLQAT